MALPVHRLIINIALLIEMLGCCCAYVVFVAKSMKQVCILIFLLHVYRTFNFLFHSPDPTLSDTCLYHIAAVHVQCNKPAFPKEILMDSEKSNKINVHVLSMTT